MKTQFHRLNAFLTLSLSGLPRWRSQYMLSVPVRGLSYQEYKL
jgi:hypothetical protein